MSQFFSNQFSHQENIPPDHPSVSAYLLSEGYGGKIYDHIINNTDWQRTSSELFDLQTWYLCNRVHYKFRANTCIWVRVVLGFFVPVISIWGWPTLALNGGLLSECPFYLLQDGTEGDSSLER